MLLFAHGSKISRETPCTPNVLRLRGGTDAAFAPPVGYMQKILLPTLRRLWGVEIADQVNFKLWSLGRKGEAQLVGVGTKGIGGGGSAMKRGYHVQITLLFPKKSH